MSLSHTSRIQTARSNSHSNWNHTKCTQTHWITLFHTLDYTRTHFRTHLNTLEHTLNTLWITIELLNFGEYAGGVTVFLSSIYIFLEQQFLQLNSYFLHFEFQIIKRFGLIQNNNFFRDDNICHMSFQIINKSLLNSSSRSNFL